jgi:AcrR family transcriptional regulator
VTSPAAVPLSRERILQCAVRVADRDGLDGASLRKVAGELGVHVTSLYNHVPTKEALLDGVVDELFGRADLPVGEVPWEQWVRRFVAGVSGLASEHPGAFAVLLRRPVQGPQSLATFEAGLAAFRRAGMDVAASYGAVKTVALAALGCCLEKASEAKQEELATDVTSLPWQDFPVLHEVTAVAEGVDVVAIVTDVLVAGLAAQLPAGASRTSARRRERPTPR